MEFQPIYLKACKRCKGDIVVREDIYGQYKQCFQCGSEDYVNVQRPVRTTKVRLPSSGKNTYNERIRLRRDVA